MFLHILCSTMHYIMHILPITMHTMHTIMHMLRITVHTMQNIMHMLSITIHNMHMCVIEYVVNYFHIGIANANTQ